MVNSAVVKNVKRAVKGKVYFGEQLNFDKFSFRDLTETAEIVKKNIEKRGDLNFVTYQYLVSYLQKKAMQS